MGTLLASWSKAFPMALVLQPRCLPPKKQKHICYTQIYLHDVPDKVAQDHFPRWAMADGSGGSADVGGSLCRKQGKLQPGPRDQNSGGNSADQMQKCTASSHPEINIKNRSKCS